MPATVDAIAARLPAWSGDTAAEFDVSALSPPLTSVPVELRLTSARLSAVMLTASSETTAEVEPRVGEHHLLVADFLDLESALVEADLGDLDPVVAFAVDEDDLESAVLVGLRRSWRCCPGRTSR